MLSTFTGGRRGRRSSRRRRWRTSIILAIVHVAVDYAIVIPVGPHRTGKATDRSANHRAWDYTDAGDRTNSGADSAADGRTGGDPAKGWIITGRRAGIILTVVIITIHNAIVRTRSPGRTGKAADCCANDRTGRDTDARKYCARHRAGARAYQSASSNVLRRLRIACAGGEAHRSSGDHRQQGFVHRLSPVLLFLRTMPRDP